MKQQIEIDAIQVDEAVIGEYNSNLKKIEQVNSKGES